MEEIRHYRDQSDQFYDVPELFLQTHLGKDLPKTEQLVVFEPLEPLMNDYLGREYYECQRFYNSFFHWDSRRDGDIIVYCRN